MESTSDNGLMIQVKNGDLDKLGLLFERYHHRLFGFFYRMTSRRDISEDLVQGVFERVLKYRSSYTGKGAFSTWIFQIARNHHADFYRDAKKLDVEEEETNWETLASHNQASNNLTNEKLDKMLLQQALEKLDSQKKQALILSRYEGFRYREIADIMDITEGAVKVRVFRALKDLKDIITDLETHHNYEK